MIKSKYSLENHNEFARLENQAKMASYDFVKELENIAIGDNIHILDAGCGSGIVSRYLVNKYKTIDIDACDVSKQRLEQAKSLCATECDKKINYFDSMLENINSPGSKYDLVLCRFVLEHVESPQSVVDELFRVTKSNGEIILIDGDGVLFNLYSQNRTLNSYLSKFRNHCNFDLFVGRKMPMMLKNAGFVNIQYRVEPMFFPGEQLHLEYRNYVQRFEFINDMLVSIFGSQAEADNFTSLYLSEMLQEGNTLFYNKFIVSAIKG